MSLRLAFLFSSLSGFELLTIAAAALMIFGGRLPEVALRMVAQIMRARRAVARMWRETGLEDELRRVRRDIENAVPRDTDFDLTPKNQSLPAKSKAEEARAAAEKARAASRKNAEEAQARKYGGGDAGDDAQPDWSGGGPAPEEPHEVDPDADRREPFTFEPMDDAIASGDDWSAGVPDPVEESHPAEEVTDAAPPAETPRLGQFGEGVPDDRP